MIKGHARSVGFSSRMKAGLRAFASAAPAGRINGLALADAHAISCHEITFWDREDDDEAA
jgi:hypothetical protein